MSLELVLRAITLETDKIIAFETFFHFELKIGTFIAVHGLLFLNLFQVMSKITYFRIS